MAPPPAFTKPVSGAFNSGRQPIVQPRLRRHSAGTDLAGVYRADNNNPATYSGLDIATTSEPENYTLPAYNIIIERRVPQGFFNRLNRLVGAMTFGDDPMEVYARVVVTRNAEEGTNISFYLRSGIYDTNMQLNEGTYRQQEQNNRGGERNVANSLAGRNGQQNRVYVIMPPQIASQNKRAEEEHLSDFIYAYDRTLGVAQRALEGLRGRTFGPHDSEDDARAAVRNAFLRAIPQPLRHLGMNMGLWANEYLRLCQKSRTERDGRRWHDFGLERVNRNELPNNLNIQYLTGVNRGETSRTYVRMNAGATQIGQHTPAQVITYGP